MIKPFLKYFLPIILFVQITDAFAQGTSNKGTDFWLGYGAHTSHGSNSMPETMVVYITSDVNTTATVAVNALSFSQTVDIVANVVSTVTIPSAAHLGVEGKSDLGIHITSVKPVIVYSHIYASSVSGATLVLPTNTLGKDYYSINYKQVSNSNFSASFFFVVAVEDGTQVEITPSQATQNGWMANTKYTVSLNKGEIYNVLGAYTNTNGTLGVDLTGSKIKSVSSTGVCKKIAVFSGSSKIAISCLNTNAAGTADNLFQQNYPTATWGKKFITVPLQDRNFDVFRIVKSEPNAVVTLNGSVIPSNLFINDFYYDFESQDVNNISADKPIQVVQYAVTQLRGIGCTTIGGDVGDPEMIYLNPLEQTLTQITMYSTPEFKILKHFINVVVKNEGVASFKVDGLSFSGSFTPFAGNTAYSYAQLSVAEGTHNLSSDVGFNAIAYGFGDHESYGYAAGANLTAFGIQSLNQMSQDIVQTGCVGNTYQLNISLPYQPTELYLDKGDGAGEQLIPNNLINNTNVDGETKYLYEIVKDLVYTAPITTTFKVRVVKPTLDDCGSGDSFSFDLIINPKPAAGFTAPAQSCLKEEIGFVHQTDPDEASVTDYLWDFNGEGTSALKDPKFTFTTTPGIKKVHFSIKYNTGCWSEVFTKDVDVVALPVAKFTTALPVCEVTPLQFTDQSTTANGVINSWLWDFGDPNSTSNSSNLKNPTHTFSTAATYNVKLTVTTASGCVNTITQQVIVKPSPVVNFIMPDICLADASAQFTNTTTIADHSALNYLWDFGDPTSATNTSTLRDPSHKYLVAAYYNVKLKVTNTSGCVAEFTKVFTVNGSSPKAVFSVENENSLCSDQPVVFVDHANVDFGSITRIEWYFDNDNHPNDRNFQLIEEHPASRTGIPKTYSFLYPAFNEVEKKFKVKMRVYSGGSCVDEIITEITLKAVPKIVFNSLASVCQEIDPYIISAAAETSNLPGSGVYSGNGITPAGLFSPASSGVGPHTIVYTFTAANGCVGVKSQDIMVYASPFANAGTDQTILIGGNVKSDATATGNNLTYKWSPSEGLDHDDIPDPVFSPVLDKKIYFKGYQ